MVIRNALFTPFSGRRRRVAHPRSPDFKIVRLFYFVLSSPVAQLHFTRTSNLQTNDFNKTRREFIE
jgi:hypothetical protein